MCGLWVAARGRGAGSTGIALLEEGVAVDVVAVLFPEAREFAVQQLDAAYPFHALPCVEVRDHKAQRVTVFSRERLAIVAQRENCRGPQKIGEGQV